MTYSLPSTTEAVVWCRLRGRGIIRLQVADSGCQTSTLLEIPFGVNPPNTYILSPMSAEEDSVLLTGVGESSTQVPSGLASEIRGKTKIPARKVMKKRFMISSLTRREANEQ